MAFSMKQLSLQDSFFQDLPSSEFTFKNLQQVKGRKPLNPVNEISSYPTEILVNCRWIHALEEKQSGCHTKKDKPGFINILVTKLILRGICSIVNNTYLENMLYAQHLLSVVTQPMNFTMFGETFSPISFPSSISLIKHFLPSSPAVATTKVHIDGDTF